MRAVAPPGSARTVTLEAGSRAYLIHFGTTSSMLASLDKPHADHPAADRGGAPTGHAAARAAVDCRVHRGYLFMQLEQRLCCWPPIPPVTTAATGLAADSGGTSTATGLFAYSPAGLQ
jgi:hypothetical protein